MNLAGLLSGSKFVGKAIALNFSRWFKIVAVELSCFIFFLSFFFPSFSWWSLYIVGVHGLRSHSLVHDFYSSKRINYWSVFPKGRILVFWWSLGLGWGSIRNFVTMISHFVRALGLHIWQPIGLLIWWTIGVLWWLMIISPLTQLNSHLCLESARHVDEITDALPFGEVMFNDTH